jgi:hypothetical protein
VVVGGIGGGGSHAIALNGMVVFEGIATRVVALDFSDAARPRRLGEVWLPGVPQGMAVDGPWLYVAAGTAGLQVVDIHDPARLRAAGAARTYDYAQDVALAGHFALVADGAGGLLSFDVADPSAPVPTGRLSAATGYGAVVAADVAVAGDLAYVADPGAGVRAIAVDDAGRLRELGRTAPGVSRPQAIAVSGSFAYVTASERAAGCGCPVSFLAVVDLTRPEQPVGRGWLVVAGAGGAPWVRGDVVLIPGGDAGIVPVLVADPDHPRRASPFSIDGPVVALAGGADDRFALARGDGHVSLWDFDGAGSAHAMGHIPIQVVDIALQDGRAYAASWPGMKILDVRDPGRPLVLGGLTLDDVPLGSPVMPWRIAVDGTVAALATHQPDGLLFVDVADPARPALVGEIALPGSPRRVRALRGRWYVAADETLLIYDAADPRAPRLLRSLHFDGTIMDFDIAAAGYLYVVQRAGPDTADSRLTAWDLAEPERPKLRHALTLEGHAEALVVRGRLAFITYWGVLGDYGSLLIFDLAAPEQPRRLVDVAGIGGYRPLAVTGDVAYIGRGSDLAAVDVRDPAQPVLLGALGPLFNDPGYHPALQALAADGPLLLVADEAVTAIDVSRLRAPRRLAAWDPPEPAWDVADVVTDGRTAFAPDGPPYDSQAVLAVDIRDPSLPSVTARIQQRSYTMALAAGRLYLATEDVAIFDVTGPGRPLELARLPLNGYDHATALAASGTTLLMGTVNGADEAKLFVVDAADPARPSWTQPWRSDTNAARAITVEGGFAYLGLSLALAVVDLRDVSAPRFVSERWDWEVGRVQALAVHGNTLLTAVGPGGLTSWDMSDKSQLRRLSHTAAAESAADLVLWGDLALVADGGAGVRVVDVHAPEQLVDLGTIRVPGEAQALALAGDTLVVAAGSAGLVLVSLHGDWRAARGRNVRFLPFTTR